MNCLIIEPEHVASHTKRIKLEPYLVPKYRKEKKRKRKKAHTRNSIAAIGVWMVQSQAGISWQSLRCM